MIELEARKTLALLLGSSSISAQKKIELTIQTAKQIGSSWPTGHINVIYHQYHQTDSGNNISHWRVVIE